METNVHARQGKFLHEHSLEAQTGRDIPEVSTCSQKSYFESRPGARRGRRCCFGGGWGDRRFRVFGGRCARGVHLCADSVYYSPATSFWGGGGFSFFPFWKVGRCQRENKETSVPKSSPDRRVGHLDGSIRARGIFLTGPSSCTRVSGHAQLCTWSCSLCSSGWFSPSKSPP